MFFPKNPYVNLITLIHYVIFYYWGFLCHVIYQHSSLIKDKTTS